MTLRAGDVVAEWTLEDRLGEGGTATVWRVRNGERRGVLKVLRDELREEADWRARILREADALRAIKHENVVALLDAGTTDDGHAFVVMPEVPGESLRAKLARETKLGPREAWRTLRPIAEALVAAHDAGIVHRDVKPDNIVLGDSPKLVDFGLARGSDVPKVTATGAPVGTPAYMAPEQWWNQSVGPPADQYALGVTLYEMIAGRAPFDDASFAELVSAHVSKPAPRLDGEPRVANFVERLLSKEPAARFPSMRDAIDAGDEAFGDAPRVRFSVTSLFFVAYGALSLVLFGYPRATTIGEWFRGAGFGIFITSIAFALAAPWIVLRANARAWLALVVAATGTFGAATAFTVVFRALRTQPAESAFALFHQGAWEAQANRYVGFTLASALFFAAEARRIVVRDARTTEARRRQAGSMIALVLACVAVTTGSPSAAIPLAALAFSFALPETPATLLGVAAAAIAAVTRAQALCDAAWSLEPTRATRALALAVAHRERALTFVAAGTCVAVALYVTRGALLRWRPRTLFARFGLAAGCVWAVADAALLVRAAIEKDAIYTHLEPEFALFAHLDPPRSPGITRTPPLRPTLKVARDRIAVDRTAVGLTSVLDTEAGIAVLRADLSHRIAAENATERDNDDVELLLMADATVAPALVTAALRAAYDVGVRRAGVLLLRGEPLPSMASLPEEAAYALPGDFDMIAVRLGDDGTPLTGATFGDAVRALGSDDVVKVSSTPNGR